VKYRDRVGIIADILKTAVNGAKKTRIMYVANLSYQMLQKYLDEAAAIGFVRSNDIGYEITEKGRVFLERYLQFSDKYSRLRGELECMNKDKSILKSMCERARTSNSEQLRRKCRR
jgi:predicted transcriptional regulator